MKPLEMHPPGPTTDLQLLSGFPAASRISSGTQTSVAAPAHATSWSDIGTFVLGQQWPPLLPGPHAVSLARSTFAKSVPLHTTGAPPFAGAALDADEELDEPPSSSADVSSCVLVMYVGLASEQPSTDPHATRTPTTTARPGLTMHLLQRGPCHVPQRRNQR